MAGPLDARKIKHLAAVLSRAGAIEFFSTDRGRIALEELDLREVWDEQFSLTYSDPLRRQSSVGGGR